MSSARSNSHSSLPAPVVHASFSVSQSKSHVLAGVQDAYWSDDEAEDAECPLCLEEMDISDLNFKPCVCGYQICRFCWHHIKENLNGRCPACRRVYTDEMVQFKPMAKDDHKRLTQQKKQRERERKELDTLGRRHLSNVRVVQRNVVYVVGIGPRFAKEELIPTLRSTEYFGQYGKISKILLVKRTPPGGGAAVVGLYITYHRREDAARAIAAVDGTPSPGGGRETMRASYGTTKYCMSFLRSQPCGDHNCKSLHEWGDEKDCFTKEDLTTLKHTIKDTESRRAAKKSDEADGLPRTAAWGSKPTTAAFAHNNTGTTNHAAPSTSRQSRRGTGTRQQRNVVPTATDSRSTAGRGHTDRKVVSTTKSPSQASSSRPSTPALTAQQNKAASSTEAKTLRPKDNGYSRRPRSPASSIAVESDLGSGPPDSTPASPISLPQSAVSIQSSMPTAPPGILAVPPSLSAPPGIPGPSRPPKVDNAPPQTPLLASQSSYQMSSAARALLDEVQIRRETLAASATISPFPDLDRTLQTLCGENGESGGFSFNLDPKLVGDDAEISEDFPNFEAEANMPFHGTYMDAFPALRPQTQGSSGAFMNPPGLPYVHNPARSIYDPLSVRASPIERQSTGGSNYTGSFNPFADGNDDSSARKAQCMPLDDDSGRKMSRFGFARGRQGSTAASSPLHNPSPLSNQDGHSPFFNTRESASPSMTHWSPPPHQPEFAYYQAGSAMGSPLVQQAQAPTAAYPQHQSRFQPFDSGVSEAQLRDLIHSSRSERGSSVPTTGNSDAEFPQFNFSGVQPQHFIDPAIMAAHFASPISPTVIADGVYANPPMLDNGHGAYGPPPGLSFPEANAAPGQSHIEQKPNEPAHASSPASLSPSFALSSSDFPALVAEPSQSPAAEDNDAEAKFQQRMTRKTLSAEKAAERLKALQEKNAAKIAERNRLLAEKAGEKKKAVDKAQFEKLLRDREKERLEKESEKIRLAAERATAAAEREKSDKAEKERIAEKEKTKKGKQHAKPSGPTASSKAPVSSVVPEPVTQVPLLSKKPKKNKPAAKPIRIPKEEEAVADEALPPPVSVPDPPPSVTKATADSSSANSRSQSLDRNSPLERTSLEEMLEEINIQNPSMDLPNHPFFDMQKINPAGKMPLEYGPLVHALSALSIGGTSFTNNVPSGSIDNAVSSFQQLLETLTQTISDLLRLLPRTTWDDSSSFDGVLREMLKGDDFLDDGGEEMHQKDDEVAALTLALERRARWMEVQLSKLEELHRDINTAAVRAVLAINDAGWDRHMSLPRVGNTLRRFDSIGMKTDASGELRPMTIEELAKKLAVAREAASFAEMEVKEIMEKMQAIRPVAVES